MVELCLIPLCKATATQFSQCRISINNDQTMSEKLENTKMKKQESSLLEVSGKVTNIKLTPILMPARAAMPEQLHQSSYTRAATPGQPCQGSHVWAATPEQPC